MKTAHDDLRQLALQGIELCRHGNWAKGLDLLGRVAEAEGRDFEPPSLFYSYLGYAVARQQKRFKEGVRLCEHAIKLEFYHPENYLNLARTFLLAGNRRGAHKALDTGLRLDPSHLGLKALQKEMGWRRPPVLRFLSRDNPLNQLLGRLRHNARPPETE
jgi:Flp pilus assembly protein TadD